LNVGWCGFKYTAVEQEYLPFLPHGYKALWLGRARQQNLFSNCP
jgi:hypothetical protein